MADTTPPKPPAIKDLRWHSSITGYGIGQLEIERMSEEQFAELSAKVRRWVAKLQ